MSDTAHPHVPRATDDADELDERGLVADALDVPARNVSLRSREPFGAGSVAGFDVVEAGETLHYYLDTSRTHVAAETGLALGDPGRPDARIWLHPADPHLPALAPVAFGHAAEAILARLGIAATGDPLLVAYRPGRRAVVSVPATGGLAWVKVVRPSRVERIVDLHERLAAGGVPLPRLRAWSPDGLIVLDDATGESAVTAPWDPEELVAGADDLMRRIAGVTLPTANRSVGERLRWYASRWVAASDSLAVDPLPAQIERVLALDEGSAEGAVHGDLHFGQLFVDGDGRITGVIDVDTAGAGDRAEDEAAFISHATASALIAVEPVARRRAETLADAARRRWAARPRVRALAAVHLLGHAVAAADRSEDALADELADAARAVLGGVGNER